jgi:hypothetical protein
MHLRSLQWYHTQSWCCRWSFNLRPGASTLFRFFQEATDTFVSLGVDSFFAALSSKEPFSLDSPCLEGFAPSIDSPIRGGKEPSVLGVRGSAFSIDATLLEATLEWGFATPAPTYGKVCNT